MTEHRAGTWPVADPVDLEPTDDQGQQHLELTRVQGRFELVLGSIRADLEEQPSPACVRSAARRWHDAITQLSEQVERQLRDTS